MNILNPLSRPAVILSLAWLLGLAGPLCAETWERANVALDRAPIEDIVSATSLCRPDEVPRITFLSKPEAMKAWPEEYVQMRWAIIDAKGSSWPHPVYLRIGERVHDGAAPGERVASIWVKNFKAAQLPEGLVSYYIVTRCGVAFAHVGKVPLPKILSAPNYALRGAEITVKGANFMDWRDDEFRSAVLIEPGQTRPIDIVSWSDKEIRARVSDDVLPGRRELYVETGLRKDRQRASNSMPILVVKQASFPAINVTHLLQDVFSRAKIRINTYKPRRDAEPYTADDSYVSLDTGYGSTRLDMLIGEYTFDVASENASVNYYLNDINLDSARVQARENDFLMTMYFEDLHDEFTAEVKGLPIGSRLAPPPAVQIDNLRVVVSFDLGASDGLLTVEPKKVEVLGDFRGSSSSCDYAGANVCEALFNKYENDVVNQLGFLVVEMISGPTGKSAISKALKPWHSTHGMGEITRATLADGSVVFDYVPN